MSHNYCDSRFSLLLLYRYLVAKVYMYLSFRLKEQGGGTEGHADV